MLQHKPHLVLIRVDLPAINPPMKRIIQIKTLMRLKIHKTMMTGMMMESLKQRKIGLPTPLRHNITCT
jgi:hypothetical protein